MSTTTRSIVAWLIVACLFGTISILAAEDTLPAAKELYGAAAYQEALAMLDRLKAVDPPADVAVEIDKYRAFCLFAMGNSRDAGQVVTEIIAAQPRFRLNENEASPRVVAAFRDVRRQQLPGIIEQAYKRGRDAYEKKRTDEAIQQFRLVLDLAGDPDVPADQSLVKDMQTLASGFLNLAETAKAAAEAKAAAPVEPPAPPPPRPTAPRYYTVQDADVLPPVVISQEMPPWPSNVRPVTTKGILEVLIDEKGAVESATMRMRLHPAFDAVVVERAKTWRYRPATLKSQPVKYMKLIEINTGQPD